MYCNQSNTRGWEVRFMLFNRMVIQLLFYRVEVWWRYLFSPIMLLEIGAHSEVLAMQVV